MKNGQMECPCEKGLFGLEKKSCLFMTGDNKIGTERVFPVTKKSDLTFHLKNNNQAFWLHATWHCAHYMCLAPICTNTPNN